MVSLSGQNSQGDSSAFGTAAFGITENAGKAGTIELNAGQLFLDDGAEITSASSGAI